MAKALDLLRDEATTVAPVVSYSELEALAGA